MNLNALKNFVSRLSFIYERSRNSNGYSLEIGAQNVDVGKQIITGKVDMIIDDDETEVIRFTSLLEQTGEVLKFESSYRVSNVKNNQEEKINVFESEEIDAEDMFFIVDDVEKTNIFDPVLGQKNKLLVHKEGDAISHVYRVGKNYNFNNGISENFMLLNMHDTGVVERVNQFFDSGVLRR